jgi:membrane-associated phospholipid phosphatase
MSPANATDGSVSNAASEHPSFRESTLPHMAIICAALMVAALSCGIDGALRDWFLIHASKTGKALASMFSQAGDYPNFLFIGGAALAVAAYRRRPVAVRVILAMLLSASLAGLFANTVRAVSGRARPNARVAVGWYGPNAGNRWLMHENQYHSFPSAHTSVAAGFALPLILACRRRRRLMASAATLAVGGIALSRLTLGVHHLSDVLGAMLIAIAATWLVTIALRRSWLLVPPQVRARPPVLTLAE